MDEYIVVKEGLARLKVPNPARYRDERGRFDPAWAPVFYNPRMRLSRDIGSALVRAYAEYTGRTRLRILDALAATGARGIRYALENRDVVAEVTLNDVNPLAAALAEENVRANGLGEIASVMREDAAVLMTRERGYDVVEVDPFGTPAPFTEPALRAVNHGGMLCLTATDMPPLLGKYPYTSIRKYFSRSIDAEFSRETGSRILLYFVAREAAKLDKRVEPLYVHSSDHYIRVCVQVLRGGSRTGGLRGNIGYVSYCPERLHRGVHEGLVPRLPETCPACGARLVHGGPLWIGGLWNPDFARRVENAYKRGYEEGYLSPRGSKMTSLIASEVGMPPLYYTTGRLASRYGIAEEPPVRRLVSRLVAEGYKASLTHFDGKGFRTDAPPEDIVSLMGEGRRAARGTLSP